MKKMVMVLLTVIFAFGSVAAYAEVELTDKEKELRAEGDRLFEEFKAVAEPFLEFFKEEDYEQYKLRFEIFLVMAMNANYFSVENLVQKTKAVSVDIYENRICDIYNYVDIDDYYVDVFELIC